VPDWVVRKANQTELVDSSPEQLRRRMLHGNICAPDRVEQALTHFFRTDNLIALRELALRFVADETEEELLKHLRRHRAVGMWETTERIMVAVTGAADDDALVRRAARIAARVRADIDVLHVVGTDGSSADRGSTGNLQQLAADVGGRWHEVEDDDPARAIAQFAGQHQITQIVIRASRRSRWRPFKGGGSTVARIIKAAGDTGIDVHVVARREPDAKEGGGSRPDG
jgi:two-component system sensor histidine kinase KdpD